jgi:hypothetical protein
MTHHYVAKMKKPGFLTETSKCVVENFRVRYENELFFEDTAFDNRIARRFERLLEGL